MSIGIKNKDTPSVSKSMVAWIPGLIINKASLHKLGMNSLQDNHSRYSASTHQDRQAP